MKKAAIFIGGFILLFGIYSIFFKSGPDTGPQIAKKHAPKTTPWAGNRLKQFNMLRPIAENDFLIKDAKYVGLKKKKATVIMTFSITGKKPKWFKGKSFYAFRPGLKAKYKPTFNLGKSGSSTTAQMVFKGIPTNSLGNTCKRSLGSPLALYMKGVPGPTMSLKLTAPPAPPGHCFDAGKKKRPKPKAKIRRIKQGKRHKIIIFGSVSHYKGKKAIVQIRGKIKSTATPVIKNKIFRARFRLPRGKYSVRVKLNKGWLNGHKFRVTK